MNLFELAHQVNDRLNGGDEGKFPITLIVVSEILYALEPINYFNSNTYWVSSGDLRRIHYGNSQSF